MDAPPAPTQPAPDAILARPIALPPAAVPRSAGPAFEWPTLSRGGALSGLGLVGLLLLAMGLVPLAVNLGFLLISGSAQPPDGQLHRFITIEKWVNALLAASAALLFVRYWRLPVAGIGLHTWRLKTQVAWGAAALGGAYAGLLVSSAVTFLLVTTFPSLQEDLSDRVKFLEVLSATSFWGSVVMLIPVAVHEEVIFRGLLIPLVHRLGCRWVLAATASATLFSVLHIAQGWLAIPQVFCVGLALGLFFVWSRSLMAVIIAHFLFNLLQLQLARVLLPLARQLSNNV